MDLEESRRRRAEARAQRRAGQKRLALLGGVAALALTGGVVAGARNGGEETPKASAATKKPEPKPPELPRGGRVLFPDWRVVAFYGAPQDEQLGELGVGKLSTMGKRLEKQAKPYIKKTRPVLPAFELIATIALADAGADGMYRAQQTKEVIDRHLRVARKAKALLILDIQPGHADFEEEVERLEPWLREPDVSLALDPEWATPTAKPGTVIGSVDAEVVNRISRRLSDIVREGNLPEKLLVIHQFTNDMIKNREALETPPGVAVTLNVDGFGTKAAKVSKYRDFTKDDGRRFNHGFKLFYEEDTGLMSPGAVLQLGPPPDLVVYE